MADDLPDQSAQPENVGPEVATTTDFATIDVNGLLNDVLIVDCDALTDVFEKAASTAAENAQALRVYRVLGGLCSFHFTPEAKSGPYGPMLRLPDGRRSMQPDDCRGDQNAALAAIIPSIDHPGLRARIADTVWLNERKRRDAADAAVEAYCESAESVRAGRMQQRFGSPHAVPNRTLAFVQRALQINAATNKDGITHRLRSLVVDLVDAAEAAGELHAIERAGFLARRYDILDAATLAPRLEACALKPSSYPLANKEVFDLAARCFQQAGDAAGALRCEIAAAEQLVLMADGMDQASAAAGWIMDAIKLFRSIKGTKDRRKGLETRLRDLQHDALDEMGQFLIPLDVSGIAKQTEDAFADKSLADALLLFAQIGGSRPEAELRQEVLDNAKNAPLRAIISMTHIDGQDGKVISRADGAPVMGDPDAEWFDREICQAEKLHRQIVVAGSIETARGIAFGLGERHFSPIVAMSPFVPPGHEHIFALGFIRLFQADFASACHLLIPQLENSIRHVLRQSGADPTMIQSDMVQEDRTLSALLESERATLDNIFGAALIAEIDRLFNSRNGPALRHEAAHGKLNVADCYGPDGIYACWLIYRITCLPLFRFWRDKVASAIEAEL